MIFRSNRVFTITSNASYSQDDFSVFSAVTYNQCRFDYVNYGKIFNDLALNILRYKKKMFIICLITKNTFVKNIFQTKKIIIMNKW